MFSPGLKEQTGNPVGKTCSVCVSCVYMHTSAHIASHRSGTVHSMDIQV